MLAPSLVLTSGESALERSLDIVANNIANSSTTGFKREGIEFDTLLNQTAPGTGINFVVDRATYRDASTGPIVATGNPLDMALQGPGYFEIQMPDGSTSYTRNGSFRLNNQGQLVTQAGYPVISEGGTGITVPATATDVTITGDGTVSAHITGIVDLSVLGKIGVATFADEQQMQAQGAGLYTTTQTPLPTVDSSVMVQGSLEQSNVSAIDEMTQLIRIQRAYEQAANLINQENTRLNTAMSVLSKTSES
jgi:flagellar basal-body rod protein FlgF